MSSTKTASSMATKSRCLWKTVRNLSQRGWVCRSSALSFHSSTTTWKSNPCCTRSPSRTATGLSSVNHWGNVSDAQSPFWFVINTKWCSLFVCFSCRRDSVGTSLKRRTLPVQRRHKLASVAWLERLEHSHVTGASWGSSSRQDQEAWSSWRACVHLHVRYNWTSESCCHHSFAIHLHCRRNSSCRRFQRQRRFLQSSASVPHRLRLHVHRSNVDFRINRRHQKEILRLSLLRRLHAIQGNSKWHRA